MMRKGIVSFVCIMIVAMSNIFYTTYLFAVDIALNYSPCSLLADYKENSRTINIKDDSVDYFDKWGYLSKASLLFLFPNNDKEHPYMTGYFIDILHKSVSIEPVDIKYFEKGGDIHIVSGIAGIMFRGPVKTTNIYFDFGFGIGYTLPNCIDVIPLFMAIAKIGAYSVPIFAGIPHMGKISIFKNMWYNLFVS